MPAAPGGRAACAPACSRHGRALSPSAKGSVEQRMHAVCSRTPEVPASTSSPLQAAGLALAQACAPVAVGPPSPPGPPPQPGCLCCRRAPPTTCAKLQMRARSDFAVGCDLPWPCTSNAYTAMPAPASCLKTSRERSRQSEGSQRFSVRILVGKGISSAARKHALDNQAGRRPLVARRRERNNSLGCVLHRPRSHALQTSSHRHQIAAPLLKH